MPGIPNPESVFGILDVHLYIIPGIRTRSRPSPGIFKTPIRAAGYEANVSVAEFLLPDDEVLEQLNDDVFFFGAASRLRVPSERLDFKFRVLKRKGYKVIDPPLMCQSNFFRALM